MIFYVHAKKLEKSDELIFKKKIIFRPDFIKFSAKTNIEYLYRVQKLSLSRSRNMINFSIIAMPKKSHFTIFAIQNFMQNMRNTSQFHLYC